MFFRKKVQTTPIFNAQDVAQVYIQIATMLYRDKGQPDGSSEVTVTLTFDTPLRVSSVDNFLVDGLPKVPSAEVIATINDILTSRAVPVEDQPKALSISVKEGQINTSPKY